jgi:hypothetical protein
MKRNYAIPILTLGLTYALSAAPAVKNEDHSTSQPPQANYQLDRRGRSQRQRVSVPYGSVSGAKKRVVSKGYGNGASRSKTTSTVYLVYNGDVVSIYNDTGKGLESQGVMLTKDLRRALHE